MMSRQSTVWVALSILFVTGCVPMSQFAEVRDDRDALDQDLETVKILNTLDIREMGGRMFAVQQRMNMLEKDGEWTEISVQALDFEREIPDYLFTLSNLRNPRD